MWILINVSKNKYENSSMMFVFIEKNKPLNTYIYDIL